MKESDGMRRDAHGYVVSRGLADAKRPWEHMPRTYSTGRRCPCGARLSIYNPDERCAPCSGERWADH